MSLIQVKLMAGLFTEPQKQEIIRQLTEVMVSFEGENLRQVTWVILEEVPSGSLGIGGMAVTTDDIKTMAFGD